MCYVYVHDSSYIRLFIEYSCHMYLNVVISNNVLILAHSCARADYYYVMTFLQTSCQFVSPAQVLTKAGVLIDKVSFSFHFWIFEGSWNWKSNLVQSSRVLLSGMVRVWDWVLRVDTIYSREISTWVMCELQYEGVIPHQLDHGPDTFHQAAAQDFLECQASARQTNCNIVSVSVQQPPFLCSVIIDSYSLSLVKNHKFLFMRIHHLLNWL
jgi:hypothetical protein